MATIVSRTNYSTSSNSFTLTNGSSAGRAVVVVAQQSRNPLNMTTATFNSVSPTSILTNSHSVTTTIRTLVAFWNNAALPAAGGSFTVDCLTQSSRHTVFEISGWDEAAPEIVNSESLLGSSSPFTVSFLGTNANSLMLLAVQQTSGSNVSGVNGSVVEFSNANSHTFSKTDTADSGSIALNSNTVNNVYTAIAFNPAPTGPDYTQRKGSTFTATHTLGTVPNSATINGLAVTLSNATTTTVDVTVDAAITTSGEYNLVIADSVAVTTQTQTVQVNVFGVVPSNNPAQKDGAALASLTGIQIRVTAGANLNGTQVYYSGTQTTDASGNFSALDVSSSAAVAADPVRMQVLTAAGDSITSAETVGLI
jgi:hypothetical protein